MADKPKKNKLVFKGEKEKKKKRKHREQDEQEDSNSLQGWVRVDCPDDFVGPLFITHVSEPPICFTVDGDNRFIAYPLPELANIEESEIEPTIVNQVFVGARLVGTDDAFTFKSFSGKYLSSDKVGEVTCDHDAIGGHEEWKPIVTDSGVAFQNVHGKYLMIDEIAGGGYKARADADDIGFCETFRVYCQSRFKHKQKKAKKTRIREDKIEQDNVKKYISKSGGRLVSLGNDVVGLRQAKTQGKFNETLLDRREKMKSDRYCK